MLRARARAQRSPAQAARGAQQRHARGEGGSTPEQCRAHLAAVLGGEGKGALPEAGRDASPVVFALRISRGQRDALPPVRRAAVDAFNQPITLGGEVLKGLSIQHRAQRGGSVWFGYTSWYPPPPLTGL